MFERISNHVYKLASGKWGIWALFISAFADASFLPLPVTTLFLILIVLNSEYILKNLFSVLIGTVTGALAGYAIGHFAWFKPNGEFTGFAQFFLNNIPGLSHEVYGKVSDLYTKYNFRILGVAVITPLPYGMFSVTSGVFNINILVFLITTIICQTIKYSFLALATIKFGVDFKRIMRFNWKSVAIITAGVLAAFVVSNIL